MYSLRVPFYLAAALNALGAFVCFFTLPESHRTVEETELRPIQLNPFASLASLRQLKGIGPLLYISCTLAMVGQVPSVLWVLYGTERFGWSAFFLLVAPLLSLVCYMPLAKSCCRTSRSGNWAQG